MKEITEILYSAKTKKQTVWTRGQTQAEVQMQKHQAEQKRDMQMREEYLKEQAQAKNEEYEKWKKDKGYE